jgi:hypothetical protein
MSDLRGAAGGLFLLALCWVCELLAPLVRRAR